MIETNPLATADSTESRVHEHFFMANPSQLFMSCSITDDEIGAGLVRNQPVKDHQQLQQPLHRDGALPEIKSDPQYLVTDIDVYDQAEAT